MSQFDKVLNEFAVAMTDAARRGLGTRRIGKNKSYGEASGLLKRSLGYKYTPDQKRLDFGARGRASGYADYIDKGVSGTLIKRDDTPYSYKGKMPPVGAILEWMKVKPVRLRDENGQFIKQTPEKLQARAFQIARSIQRKGIHGLRYWSRGYKVTWPYYQTKIADAIADDVVADAMKRLNP